MLLQTTTICVIAKHFPNFQTPCSTMLTSPSPGISVTRTRPMWTSIRTWTLSRGTAGTSDIPSLLVILATFGLTFASRDVTFTLGDHTCVPSHVRLCLTHSILTAKQIWFFVLFCNFSLLALHQEQSKKHFKVLKIHRFIN